MKRKEESKIEETTEITEVDVKRAVKRMKQKNICGEDGLKNQVWIQAMKNVLDLVKKIINKVWIERQFPKRSGNGKKVKNCRGISINATRCMPQYYIGNWKK